MKRKIISLLLAVVLLLFVTIACDNRNDSANGQVTTAFSVNFIDVGQGDSIFINFGDGKCMLIDTGYTDKNVCSNIINVIKAYSVENIDYLVLTHPDLDHVGNSIEIIDNFSIGKACLPYIINTSLIEDYAKILNKLKDKKIETVTSVINQTIRGDDYILMFLSPLPFNNPESSYFDYNFQPFPTAEQTNNLSPIIYLEYKGVSFVFTGDAGVSQEKLVLKNYEVNYYNKVLGEEKIHLENIDFLKVAHHGSKDCSSKDFLNLLCPNNAVISVGGSNNYGHPSLTTIENLLLSNKDCKILRTDRDGTISVGVDKNSEITIQTQGVR